MEFTKHSRAVALQKHEDINYFHRSVLINVEEVYSDDGINNYPSEPL